MRDFDTHDIFENYKKHYGYEVIETIEGILKVDLYDVYEKYFVTAGPDDYDKEYDGIPKKVMYQNKPVQVRYYTKEESDEWQYHNWEGPDYVGHSGGDIIVQKDGKIGDKVTRQIIEFSDKNPRNPFTGDYRMFKYEFGHHNYDKVPFPYYDQYVNFKAVDIGVSNLGGI